jgi:ATP-binding cassette subfamily B (MDR/TAP) protein 1
MLPLFGGAIAAFQRLRKDIETEPTIDNTSTSAEKITKADGAIEFRDVAFTYSSRPDHPVLNSISLKCEAGTFSPLSMDPSRTTRCETYA